MRMVFPTAFSATMLLLGFNMQVAHINAFSLSPSIPRSIAFGHQRSFDKDIGIHVRKVTALSADAYSGQYISGLTPDQIVSTRFLHRLSPTKSSVQSPYTIEERQQYSVAADGKLIPFGGKSILFRADSGNDHGDNIALGPAIHTLQGLQMGDDSATVGSSYAMALYCMLRPEIISGTGLEVSSGVGVGGILSAVGAGLVLSSGYTNGESSPTPDTLSKLLMTDSNKNLLNTCVGNLGATSFPVPKVELGVLDWTKHVQDSMADRFDFIIGCNCAHDFTPLAKTVAHSIISDASARSIFVHIGPENRKNTAGLKIELGSRYRMNTIVKDIQLERIQLAPAIEDAPDSQYEYVRAAGVETKKFSAILAYYDEAVKETFASSPGETSDDLLRAAYTEWCEIFHKQMDESRFQTFTSNFLIMKAIATDRGEPMKLNQWFDCTEEEYYAQIGMPIATDELHTNNVPTHEEIEKLDKAKMRAIEELAEIEVSQFAEAQAELLVTGDSERFSAIEDEANAKTETKIDEEFQAQLTADRLFRANQIKAENRAEEIGMLAIEAEQKLIEAQVEALVDSSVERSCEKAAEEEAVTSIGKV